MLLVEFSSEAAIQKAIESTAGEGVGLMTAGAKANEAMQRDRAAADERRVRQRFE